MNNNNNNEKTKDIFIRNILEEDFDYLRLLKENYRVSWPLLIRAIVKFLKEKEFKIEGL